MRDRSRSLGETLVQLRRFVILVVPGIDQPDAVLEEAAASVKEEVAKAASPAAVRRVLYGATVGRLKELAAVSSANSRLGPLRQQKAESALFDDIRAEHVRKFRELSFEERTALALVSIEKFPAHEAAEIMSMTQTAFRRRLEEARQTFHSRCDHVETDAAG